MLEIIVAITATLWNIILLWWLCAAEITGRGAGGIRFIGLLGVAASMACAAVVLVG